MFLLVTNVSLIGYYWQMLYFGILYIYIYISTIWLKESQGKKEKLLTKWFKEANNRKSRMWLPWWLEGQRCCHLLPPWLEETQQLLPPLKSEQLFELSMANPTPKTPKLSNSRASCIIKKYYSMSMTCQLMMWEQNGMFWIYLFSNATCTKMIYQTTHVKIYYWLAYSYNLHMDK